MDLLTHEYIHTVWKEILSCLIFGCPKVSQTSVFNNGDRCVPLEWNPSPLKVADRTGEARHILDMFLPPCWSLKEPNSQLGWSIQLSIIQLADMIHLCLCWYYKSLQRLEMCKKMLLNNCPFFLQLWIVWEQLFHIISVLLFCISITLPKRYWTSTERDRGKWKITTATNKQNKTKKPESLLSNALGTLK